jgi:hypothetical protein
MNRLYAYDDSSLTIGVIPQDCPSCDGRIERVRLSLEPVVSSTAEFVGLRTVGETTCCGGPYRTACPAIRVAAALNHLQSCPHH